MEFRFARHSLNIENLINFYTSVLNFELLGRFENHDGYSGVFLGIKGENWHLEFTENKHQPLSKFDEDDALVFYPKTKIAFGEIVKNSKKFQLQLLETKNPYWKNKGICFADCDGYKIIVSAEKIEV